MLHKLILIILIHYVSTVEFVKEAGKSVRAIVSQIGGDVPYRAECETPIYEKWQNSFVASSVPASTFGGDVGATALASAYQVGCNINI